MLHESFSKAILRMFIEKYVSIIEKINVQNNAVCTLLENPAFESYVEFYSNNKRKTVWKLRKNCTILAEIRVSV